jgi:competence protein ComEC
MKLPALGIVAALASGILLADRVPVAPVICFAAALSAIVAGAAFAKFEKLTSAWVFALLAWAALGSAGSRIEQLPLPSNHVARLVAEQHLDVSEPLRWRGRLRNDPLPLPWGVRYEMELDEVEAEGRAIPITGGLRVSYFRNAKIPETLAPVRAGDRVEALVRARALRNYLDPGAFDARGYFARQGIYLAGTLRSAELLRPLSTPPMTVRHRFARLRGTLLARVNALFADSPERTAVLRAMLLGDRSFVDSDLAVEFQKTAAYHVLVVAGLHVAALAMFVFWLGRRMRLSLVLTTVLTLLVLAAYVGVVEDRPPILRAALMGTVFLSARLLFRRVELLNIVAVAAILLLLARPSALTDASFQLSFLAAGVIAALALPWIERTSAPYRAGLAHLGDMTRDVAHPPRVVQFRLDLRSAARWIAGRLPRRLQRFADSFCTWPLRVFFRLWEVALLSTVIQLGMLPVLAHYFHRVSLSGPLSNIGAVLLTGLIVPLGFFTLLVSFAWAGLATLSGKLLGLLLAGLLGSVEWFSRLPRASYRIPGPPVWLLIAFFAVFALLAVAARRRLSRSDARLRWMERFAATALLVLAALTATHPFAPRLERGRLEVTVLDVGQGDSIFTAFPGGRTMLIDGGGAYGESHFGGYRTGGDIGEQVVSPYLWQRGLKRLDVVALTHAHHDHLDGLNAVLDNFQVGELWVGRDVDSAAYRDLLARAASRGIKIVHHQRGDTFAWDGATGRVLWPANTTATAEASNNDSLVIRLEDGRERFLLPGDIEESVEDGLAREGDSLSADFLKVPHHGSKTSSTAEFLAAVSPKVAVVSVGERNPFGHPSPAVVERFAARGVRLLRTDRDGAVTATTDGRALVLYIYAALGHD